MRVALLLILSALLSVGAAVGLRARQAAAQEEVWTLYVSGMSVGGKSRALLRLTNVAPEGGGDLYFVHYTVRATNGAHISRLGAGPVGAQLLPGQTLELDLGLIVDQYRASLGMSGFVGPVQLVAFGEGGATDVFSPRTVKVEAVQQEGQAQFPAVVKWRR